MADVITRLKLESNEYDNKIKRAAQVLLQMEQECRRVGGSLSVLEKSQTEFVRSLGKMETVSQTARGRLGELSSAFTELRSQYNRLTQEEKQGDYGKALNQSLEQLKGRIKDTKKELASINQELNGGKFGQFGNIIDTVGHKLGLTANATDLLTSKTALMYSGIGAGIAVIGKATEAWASYNAELAKQEQITTVTTGLKDDDAKRMTDTMRALADTYNVDFREAVNAANTLMTQFGKTGDEATQLIKDGMQGMIQGDGPKLLQMIQQYAPAFRDAGVSASQLVAVIQNSEGGIFTDQNMNAIVMGIKNIRLMTKATSDALARLGIDGQDMTKKMSDGSITVFDALKQVASQLKTVDSNSQAAGEVMQQVFGRQGAMAGTNLAKAIETLNLNLEETKRQTGEVGKAYADLQTANEKLNVAIRECFSYDGWDQMATGIKSKLVTVLASVIEKLAVIKNLYGSITPNGPRQDNRQGNGYSDMDKVFAYIQTGTSQADREKRYDQQLASINRRLSQIGRERKVTSSDGSVSYQVDTQEVQQQKREALLNRRLMLINRRDDLMRGTPTPSEQLTPLPSDNSQNSPKGGTTKTTATKELDENQKIQRRINELVQEAYTADDDRLAVIREEIAGLQEQEKKLANIKNLVTGNVAATDPNKEFPDYSKQNYNTGYAGSVQSKVVSARADFAMGPLNLDTVKQYASDIKGALRDADFGTDLYNSLTEQLKDATTVSTLLQKLMERGLEGVDLENIATALREKLLSPEGIDQDAVATWLEALSKQIEEAGGVGLKINAETGEVSDKKSDKDKKNDKAEIQRTKELVSGMGQVANGLQHLGVELPKEVNDVLGFLNGLMSVIQGVQTIIGVFQVGATTANTVALNTLTGVLLAKSFILGLAQGGIAHAANGFVPGNDHSDGIPVMVSSGELILNKAQQGVLADTLQNGGMANWHLETEFSVESIRILLNNNSQRRGKGRYVTSKQTK